jgi:hypothetical protein
MCVCVYIYTHIHICMDKCGKQLCKDHKINTLITHCTLHHCTKHIAQAYTFENEFYPAKAIQQRQHVDAAGCRTFIRGLITMFVFDVLQIPSKCI